MTTSTTSSSRRPRLRRGLVVAGAALAALTLSGCDGLDRGGRDIGEPDAAPRTLTVSTAWLQANSDDGQAQLARLRAAIDDLRTQTGSGWTGRQDDLTGHLAELTGGRWFPGTTDDELTPEGAATSLMDTWGEQLFGVTAADLALEPTTPALDNDTAALRATQQVAGVPVLDAGLVFTIGASSTDPRVNAVRGRVHADLDVDTRPAIGVARAMRIVTRLSQGVVQGPPDLVVLPEPETGTLVWQVAVSGSSSDELGSRDGYWYVDAQDGAVVTTRTTTVERSAPAALEVGSVGEAIRASRSERRLARAGSLAATSHPAGAAESVQVSGTGPIGDPLVANGRLTGAGIVLDDVTVPTYDPSTGGGSILTYDAQGATENTGLPGVPYVERNGTVITDSEALAAHAYSRAVYDYFASLGRASWDGQGGTLVSSVNFGGSSFCNSFFNNGLNPPQMVYGDPCVVDGEPWENSELDIDTAGHEITHGVIATSSNLQYLGPSGALNEGFADYFGNVIGDLFRDRSSSAIMEDSCYGITTPNPICAANPEGELSIRYMLNGNTYDDYLFLLDPPLRSLNLGLSDQDQGGVHLNSAVWNNALWSIRTQLATIDGAEPNDSELATDFDKIVYYALVNQLTPTANFFDARAAIEQTITDAGADAVIARVAREVFDRNLICAGCGDAGPVPGIPLASTGQAETSPAVSGDKVTWLLQSPGGLGGAAQGSVEGGSSRVGDLPELAQVGFAGDAVVALSYPGGQVPGEVVRLGPDGTQGVLAPAGVSTLNAGLAGSDDGAAWATAEDESVRFVDADGVVTRTGYPGGGGDTVTAVGTGAGRVGMGTEQGRVWLWQPGGEPTEIGRMPSAVLAVAAYGDRVVAVDDAGQVSYFDGSGREVVLSRSAVPYGAAMGEDYVVWAEATGELGGGVAESQGVSLPDTDLHLWSARSGTIYNLLPQRGQQGFPALSGDRLVWQDSVLGGDDVFTATIPPGL